MKQALGIIATVAIVAVGVHYQARPPAPATVRVSVEPPPSDAVARGRLVYQTYGCAMCHGPDAKGGFANLNSESEGKVPANRVRREQGEVLGNIADTPPFRSQEFSR